MPPQNQNLTLKLTIDTTEGAKLTAFLDSQDANVKKVASTTKLLADIDKQRLAISKDVTDAYARLEDIVARGQQRISENGRGANLTLKNTEIAVDAINKKYKEQLILLEQLNQKERVIRGGNTAYGGNIGYSGPVTNRQSYNTTDAAVERAIQGRLQREEELRRNFNASTEAIEREAAARREHITQSEANARTIMYADIFTQIEAREQALNTRRTAQSGYAAQANQDEHTLATTARARELASLREALHEQHQLRVASFDSSIQTQLAHTRAAIAVETAEQVHGINSIQAARVRAAEQTRQIEERLNAQLNAIRQAHSSGQISTPVANSGVRLAMDSYTTSVHANTAALRENEAALATQTTRQHNLFLRVGEFIGLYRLYNLAIQGISTSLRAIPKAGLEQQETQSSLLGIFGTQQGNANIQFIHDIAQEAGQSVLVLEQAYRRFAPSAILAGANQQQVNQSFKDFAEVGTILHLPEEKINSLFLALDQMFAKGVVQSEEVKKQLGNVLPGAVEVFAKSMGKTPAEFMAAMKKNEVIATEAVPKFAALYRKIFGGPDDSVFRLVQDRLQSNLYRLENSYLNMNRAIFANTQYTMNEVTKVFIKAIDTITKNLEGIGQSVDILATLITVRLGVAAIGGIITNIVLLGAKLNAFSVIVTGLSIPMVAFATGIVTLYAKINDLSASYDKVNGFTITYKDSTVSLISYIQATALNAYTALRDILVSIRDTMQELSAPESSDWLRQVTNIIPSNQDLAEFKAFLGAISDVNANKSMQKPLTFDDAYAKRIANAKEWLNESKNINDAAILDQEKLIQSFSKMGKSVLDVQKAIAAGKLNAINLHKPFTSLQAQTDDNITRALAGAVPDIPATDYSSTASETPIDNKVTSAAISKERELLQQRLANIAQDTTIAKIKLNNQLQQLDFNQNNPKLGQNLENTVYYDKKVALNKQLLDLDVQQNKLELEANVITKKRLDLLVKESEVSVANKDNIIKAIREQESGSKERTNTSDRAVSSTGAVGSMQIFKAAWIDAGNAEKDFTKATYDELDKAGQDYFVKQLNRFKDLELALAAYKQGPTSVAELYAKEGVDVGTITPESLTKIKAQLSDVTKTYISQTIARLPATKAENKDISTQTTINTLIQQGEQIQLTNEQKLKELAQQKLVSLQEYRQLYIQLHSDALKAQGKIDEAETLKITNKYLADEIILRTTITELESKSAEELGKIGQQSLANAKQALTDLTITKQLDIFNKNIAFVKQQEALATANLQNVEKQVQIERELGISSTIDGVNRIISARQPLLASLQKEKELIEKQLADNKDNISLQLDLIEINSKIAQQAYPSAGANKAFNQSPLLTQKNNSDQAALLSFQDSNTKANMDAFNQFKDPSKKTIDIQNQLQANLEDNKKQFYTRQTLNDLAYYGGMADIASNSFNTITASMAKMYGANSKAAREAFAVGKAFSIASAIINTAEGVTKAIAQGGIVGIATGAVVAAAGAIEIASIAAQKPPQAHGGLDYVPENNQTYLLSKGERVLAPQQNKDLTNYLNQNKMAANQSNMQQPTPNVNVKVVNAVDPALFDEWASSPNGEKTIMNTVRRNRG